MSQSMSSVCSLSREKSFILVPKHAALNPHFSYFAISRKQPLQPRSLCRSLTPHHKKPLAIPCAVYEKAVVLRLYDEHHHFTSLQSRWTALCDTQDDGSDVVKARGTKAGWGVAYRSGTAGGCDGTSRVRTYSVVYGVRSPE